MTSLFRISILALAALGVLRSMAYADTPERPPSGADLEEGIVTAEISQISRRDLIGYYSRDTVFVRYTAIAEFMGIIHAVSADGDTLSGEMPTGSPFMFVASAQTFHRYGAVDTLPARSIRERDGEIVISFAELNRVLSLGGSFEYDRLRILLPPDPKLPTVDVRQAMKRYARLGTGDNPTPEQEIVRLNRSLVGALGVDWGVMNTATQDHQNTIGTLGISTPLLYGVLALRGRATMTSADLQGVALGFESATWRLDLPELPMLNTVTLGFRPSVSSPTYSVGLSGATFAGRASDFGTREISGSATPGWWAELHDGPRLVEVVRVGDDGEYSFEVPMTATTLRRKVVLRGPHGERVSEDHLMRIGSDMLPAGDFRWNLGGTTFDHLGSRAVSGSAGLRIGVLNRLTLDLVTALPAMLAEKIHPDSLRSSVGVRLALFDATPISLSIDPRTLRFGTGFTIDPFDVAPVLVRLDSVDLRQGTFGAAASTRLTVGPMTLGALGRYINRWDRRGFEVSPSLTLRLFGITLGSNLRASRVERLVAAGEGEEKRQTDERLALRALASFSPFSGVRVRLGASYDFLTNRLIESNAGVTFPIVDALTASAQYSMPGTDWRNGSFGLNLGLRLPFARGSVSSRYDNDRLSTQSRLAGAFVVSSAGVDAVREHVASRAQILTVAFHDLNLNGVYDGADTAIGTVDMEVLTAAGGSIASGDLFEALPIRSTFIAQVNAEQYAHLGLYPLRARSEMALPSGVSEVIYVPFAGGSDLLGTGEIRLPSGRTGNVAALFGLVVRLVSIDGVAEYQSEFINDGTYLVSGVAPGRYRVVVDNDALMAMGLALEPMHEEIVVEHDTQTIAPIVFVPLANFSTPSEADEWE